MTTVGSRFAYLKVTGNIMVSSTLNTYILMDEYYHTYILVYATMISMKTWLFLGVEDKVDGKQVSKS